VECNGKPSGSLALRRGRRRGRGGRTSGGDLDRLTILGRLFDPTDRRLTVAEPLSPDAVVAKLVTRDPIRPRVALQ
jgi:hypothetical protein